jgi:predicted ferric reductase
MGDRGPRTILGWAAVAVAVGLPLAAAARSPLLAYRDPIYITACFAGVVALGLLFIQPLLIGGYLPGLTTHGSRRSHRAVGSALVGAIIVHVGGLWITSPPDVVDALTFTSPAPFSAWGVTAMWALFATALLALLRRRLRIRPRTWRIGHKALAVVIVVGTAVHAVLIEGTMETITKVALCGLVIGATLAALAGLQRATVTRSE